MAMLGVMAAAMVVLTGVLAYAMTRRYGVRLAILLPVLALVAMFAMRWQNEAMTLDEGVAALGPTLIYAAPILLGVAIGVLIARLTRS